MGNEKSKKNKNSYLGILKEYIGIAPSLLIFPYVIGFFSVNLYLYQQGINTSEALNLNYLTIGFFNICTIFSSIICFLISIKIRKTITNVKNSSLFSVLFYNASSITLILAQINVFFDRVDYVIWTIYPLTTLFILPLLFYLEVKISKITLLFFNFLLIIFISYLYFTSNDYLKYFLEAHASTWLMFLLLLVVIMHFLDVYVIKYTIVLATAFVLLATITCSVVYNSVIYIPYLRISIGGIRPTHGEIFLKDDCKFNDKDTLSIYHKVDCHSPVKILYESDKKIIIEDSLTTLEIESDCIRSVNRLRSN